MILQDLHMHTIYDDGSDTAEKMVCSAISKGLDSVGISVHSPILNESWCAKKEKVPEFINEINKLKNIYDGKIRIFCGIEYDLFSDTDLSLFDYVIGSTHMIRTGETVLSVDNTAQELKKIIDYYGSEISFEEQYFNQVLEFADNDEIDIIGHLDLPTKFNEKERIINTESDEYKKMLDYTVKLLCSKDKIFEVNSGAISRGYRSSPYPSDYALTLVKKYNGRVLLSSDAHSYTNIAYSFDNSLSLIKKCGFNSIAYFDGSNFVNKNI